MRIYDFVKEHVMPFNAVIMMSITVAAVLDFLAPQAAYLAWLSYALAALVLTGMTLELLYQRANANADAPYARLLGWLRSPPGPLWNSPAWQVIGIIAVIALVLGQASKARAANGGLIASAAPNFRNVQVLLLGLQADTQRIQATLTGMDSKVDSIHSSVGELESALKGPTEYLEQGDYPFLQKYVAAGKKLPQSGVHLLLGLNRKRDDRFDLLQLYVSQGFDIQRPVPVETLTFDTMIDDIPTIKNIAKINAWARKNFQLDASTLLTSCKTMDLLAYSYVASDKPLTDWLIRQGVRPDAKYACELGAAGVKQWTVTANDIQTVLKQ